MPTFEEEEIESNEEVELKEEIELRKEKKVGDRPSVGSQDYGCKHYNRRCRIRAPCCNEIFGCHRCHDEAKNTNEVDDSNRHEIGCHCVEKIICTLCDHEQDVKQGCGNCGACMADCYCPKCKLFDNEILCRDKSFHCVRCSTDRNTKVSLGSASSSYSAYPATFASEYYSPRIHSIIMERRDKSGMDKVESEVEASRVTWSELSASAGDEFATDDLNVFKSLQEQWPGEFFQDYPEGTWKLGWKLAEGGQAELFEVFKFHTQSDDVCRGRLVIKVFKEGLRLQDLQRLLPHAMLGDEWARKYGFFHAGGYCNRIHGAILLNGRFALVMPRMWGDLRKLIDARMIHNDMQGPPFTEEETGFCMLGIATGMKHLHRMNITHGDLKAANVLVWAIDNYRYLLDPIRGRFACAVADFECSVGVVGTGFWRAPEILLGVKSRNVTPELFTKASDVYSYGMTCYEILTGRIPFEVEDFKANEYDRVIGGYRPSLLSKSPNWMKALLSRCWHKNPCKRPSFEVIEHILLTHLEGLDRLDEYPELRCKTFSRGRRMFEQAKFRLQTLFME